MEKLKSFALELGCGCSTSFHLASRAAAGLAVGLSSFPLARLGNHQAVLPPEVAVPPALGHMVSSLSWQAHRKLLPLFLDTVSAAAVSWNDPQTVFCSSDLPGWFLPSVGPPEAPARSGAAVGAVVLGLPGTMGAERGFSQVAVAFRVCPSKQTA